MILTTGTLVLGYAKNTYSCSNCSRPLLCPKVSSCSESGDESCSPLTMAITVLQVYGSETEYYVHHKNHLKEFWCNFIGTDDESGCHNSDGNYSGKSTNSR